MHKTRERERERVDRRRYEKEKRKEQRFSYILFSTSPGLNFFIDPTPYFMTCSLGEICLLLFVNIKLCIKVCRNFRKISIEKIQFILYHES
jgi:hypothetical protein